MVEPGRPQMTIWHIRVKCCIPKAADTLRVCNTYCFSTAAVVTRTLLGVTSYVHRLSCLILLIFSLLVVPTEDRTWLILQYDLTLTTGRLRCVKVIPLQTR